MKYYLLTYTEDINEQGAFFQYKIHSIKGIMYYEWGGTFDCSKEIEIDLIVPEISLVNNAKHTSYLNGSIIPCFKVLDNKFIEFIAKYDIGKFQKWPIKVHHRKKTLDNYSLYYLSETQDNNIINFKDSFFSIGPDHLSKGREPRSRITIDSIETFWSTRSKLDENDSLKTENLIIDLRNFNKDMFRLNMLNINGYFISERLAEAMDKENFNGYSFKSLDVYFEEGTFLYS